MQAFVYSCYIPACTTWRNCCWRSNPSVGGSLPMLTSFGFPFLLFFCQPFCIYENTYHPASANSVILEDFRTYDVTASLLIASKSLLKCSWGYLQNAFKFCSQPGGILSMLLLISPWISPWYHSLSAQETQPKLSLFHHPSYWLSKLDW